MSDERVRARVFVSGRVQGVCFRIHAREEARRLALVGWVRNLPDGRVELLAEGPLSEVDELLEWCHEGPPAASVRGVEVSWEEPALDGRKFRITR